MTRPSSALWIFGAWLVAIPLLFVLAYSTGDAGEFHPPWEKFRNELRNPHLLVPPPGLILFAGFENVAVFLIRLSHPAVLLLPFLFVPMLTFWLIQVSLKTVQPYKNALSWNRQLVLKNSDTDENTKLV